MPSLAGKTLLLSGATRGIGLAIACRAARDGAQIVLLGKTQQPHPKLPGTLASAAAEVERAGGAALPVLCDIRSKTRSRTPSTEPSHSPGAIDICINNASAVSPTTTLNTEIKRYDLRQAVNSRGTFLVTKLCLPHLLQAVNPHVLTLSPPLDLVSKWFAPHLAYTMSKMGMSMTTLGLAAEFAQHGVAVNSLWPLTVIDTAAVRNVLGGDSTAATSRPADSYRDPDRAAGRTAMTTLNNTLSAGVRQH